MNNYYTYFHIRNDTREVFYVGKGKNNRAFVKRCRNLHWKRIVNKHGYSVEFVNQNLTEIQAHKFEEFWIKVFGRQDIQEGQLVNYTDGGEGTSGYKYTDEQRLKMSTSRKGMSTSKLQKEIVGSRYKGKTGFEHNRSKAVKCLETGLIYGSYSEAAKMLNVNASTIYLSIKDNRKTKIGTFVLI